MPHADASLLPDTVVSKAALWEHIHGQLAILIDGQRNWVSNLANASALIYSSLLAFTPGFGAGDRAVNWCGFYLDASLFPTPQYYTASLGPIDDRTTRSDSDAAPSSGGDYSSRSRLLLGPFCGKPACQFIETSPGRARGVCADAFLKRSTLVVPDVDAYPGHIACDGDTKSELVCPLILGDRAIGVLDLDCLALGGFEEVDRQGIEKIAALLVRVCDW